MAMSNTDSSLRERGEHLMEMARNASTKEDWKKIWEIPRPDIAFTWGTCWKQCVEYHVNDFASEVAFYLDVLGLSFNAFDPNYAMFTSPDHAFYLAVTPANDDSPAVTPNTMRVEFMVEDIHATVEKLAQRGLVVDEVSQPWGENNPMHIARFLTPNGVGITLWCMVTAPAAAEPEAQTSA
jgi:catechol 2,3-dioxygenase-like lactoylglutathione lyase family enzyme